MNSTAFADRRRDFLTQLPEGSVAILFSSSEKVRSRDTHFPFRQDSDFYYLTGFEEPESVAVFIPGRKEGEFILFNRKRDEAAEIWTGKRFGQKGAVEFFGADEAFPVNELSTYMPGFLQNQKQLYFPFERQMEWGPKIGRWLAAARAQRKGVSAPTAVVDTSIILHEMRLIKSDEELGLMRRAAQISVAGHEALLTACKPGMHEYELEAELWRVFRQQGAQAMAYNSIVGAGENTCTLHYEANCKKIADGDLVLVDAAAEFDYYAADITRTFPANGKFTDRQKDIYQLVLQSQTAVIDAIKPGMPWDELQTISARVISQGLLDLGLLKGNLDQVLSEKTYQTFYLHKIGHWLGIDVHDVAQYKLDGQWRALAPGMTFTVEPGIYIPAGSSQVPEEWWNIGVRIEDDLLVTPNGSEVLTAGLPKTVEAMERRC